MPGTALRRLAGILCLLAAAALAPAAARAQPAGGAPAPAVCKIGVNVEDLYDLDMARDTFGAILWIWSLCPTADVAPLGTLAFPTATTSLSLSPVEATDLAAGGQYASRRVQGTFRFDWNVDDYPFDRQHLVIPVDETEYGAARLLFEPDSAQSFVTPDLRSRLQGWTVSDLTLGTSVSEEASTYGIPGVEGARYARVEIALDLERHDVVTFMKLTSGVFAAVFIAFLSFFYDPNDRGGFGGKLGLLVGVLFAVLINMRTADASIGDTGHLTLVTWIHLVTLGFIVVLALIATRDRRRSERGETLRHPDWPTLAAVSGVYVLLVGGMIAAAALR